MPPKPTHYEGSVHRRLAQLNGLLRTANDEGKDKAQSASETVDAYDREYTKRVEAERKRRERQLKLERSRRPKAAPPPQRMISDILVEVEAEDEQQRQLLEDVSNAAPPEMLTSCTALNESTAYSSSCSSCSSASIGGSPRSKSSHSSCDADQSTTDDDSSLSSSEECSCSSSTSASMCSDGCSDDHDDLTLAQVLACNKRKRLEDCNELRPSSCTEAANEAGPSPQRSGPKNKNRQVFDFDSDDDATLFELLQRDEKKGSESIGHTGFPVRETARGGQDSGKKETQGEVHSADDVEDPSILRPTDLNEEQATSPCSDQDDDELQEVTSPRTPKIPAMPFPTLTPAQKRSLTKELQRRCKLLHKASAAEIVATVLRSEIRNIRQTLPDSEDRCHDAPGGEASMVLKQLRLLRLKTGASTSAHPVETWDVDASPNRTTGRRTKKSGVNLLEPPELQFNKQDEDRSQRSSSTTHHQDLLQSCFMPRGALSILLPHQIKGVQFLLHNLCQKERGCVLADFMGLGKTVQCCASLSLLMGSKPIRQAATAHNDILYATATENHQRLKALILAPNGVCPNWIAELTRWSKTIVFEAITASSNNNHGAGGSGGIKEFLSSDLWGNTSGQKRKRDEQEGVVGAFDDGGSPVLVAGGGGNHPMFPAPSSGNQHPSLFGTKSKSAKSSNNSEETWDKPAHFEVPPTTSIPPALKRKFLNAMEHHDGKTNLFLTPRQLLEVLYPSTVVVDDDANDGGNVDGLDVASNADDERDNIESLELKRAKKEKQPKEVGHDDDDDDARLVVRFTRFEEVPMLSFERVAVTLIASELMELIPAVEVGAELVHLQHPTATSSTRQSQQPSGQKKTSDFIEDFGMFLPSPDASCSVGLNNIDQFSSAPTLFHRGDVLLALTYLPPLPLSTESDVIADPFGFGGDLDDFELDTPALLSKQCIAVYWGPVQPAVCVEHCPFSLHEVLVETSPGVLDVKLLPAELLHVLFTVEEENIHDMAPRELAAACFHAAFEKVRLDKLRLGHIFPKHEVPTSGEFGGAVCPLVTLPLLGKAHQKERQARRMGRIDSETPAASPSRKGFCEELEPPVSYSRVPQPPDDVLVEALMNNLPDGGLPDGLTLVFDMTSATAISAQELRLFNKFGGVAVMPYSQFRLGALDIAEEAIRQVEEEVCAAKKKKPKSGFGAGGFGKKVKAGLATSNEPTDDLLESSSTPVVSLEPDVVFLDEGHVLRSKTSDIVKKLNGRLQTNRRVVLSGYPLQNSLSEFYSMLGWCSKDRLYQPELLGSESSFSHRFQVPIEMLLRSLSSESGKGSLMIQDETHVIRKKKRLMRTLLFLGIVEPYVLRRGLSVLSQYAAPRSVARILLRPTKVQVAAYTLVSSGSILGAEHGNKNKKKGSIDEPGDEDEDEDDNLLLSDLLNTGGSTNTKPGDVVGKRRGGRRGGGANILGLTAILSQVLLLPLCDVYKHFCSKTLTKSEKRSAAADGTGSSGVVGNVVKELLEENKSIFTDSSPTPKMVALFALLHRCKASGAQAIVFSQYLASLDAVEKHNLKQKNESSSQRLRILRCDGSVPVELRTQRCAAFNAGEADVLVFSLRTGCEGLNLIGASLVVSLDPAWNPAVEHESYARAYRIGQANPVEVVTIAVDGSVEELMFQQQERKRRMMRAIIDGALPNPGDGASDTVTTRHEQLVGRQHTHYGTNGGVTAAVTVLEEVELKANNATIKVRDVAPLMLHTKTTEAAKGSDEAPEVDVLPPHSFVAGIASSTHDAVEKSTSLLPPSVIKSVKELQYDDKVQNSTLDLFVDDLLLEQEKHHHQQTKDPCDRGFNQERLSSSIALRDVCLDELMHLARDDLRYETTTSAAMKASSVDTSKAISDQQNQESADLNNDRVVTEERAPHSGGGLLPGDDDGGFDMDFSGPSLVGGVATSATVFRVDDTMEFDETTASASARRTENLRKQLDALGPAVTALSPQKRNVKEEEE